MSTKSVTADEKRRKTESLLTEYEKHRDEIHLLMELQDKLFVRGVTAVGAIIGYAFYRPENRILLSLVPFAIGLFFVRYISCTQTIVRLAVHVRKIEDEIGFEQFDWEGQYGVTSETADVYDFPSIVTLYLTVGVLYFVSVVVSLVVVQEFVIEFQGFDLRITSEVVTLGYVFFTSILTYVSASNFFTIRDRRRQFGHGEGDDAPTILDVDPSEIADRFLTLREHAWGRFFDRRTKGDD